MVVFLLLLLSKATYLEFQIPTKLVYETYQQVETVVETVFS